MPCILAARLLCPFFSRRRLQRDYLSAVVTQALLVKKILEGPFSTAGTRLVPGLDRNSVAHIVVVPLFSCGRKRIRLYPFRPSLSSRFIPEQRLVILESVGSEVWRGRDPVRLDTRNIVAVIDTEYKAVFLDNGRAYFGRLLERTTDYLLLKDVFLIEREMTQEWGGKMVRVILVKGENGREPQDHMFINAGHILAVWSVSAKPEK
jgi:hypothetical protein